MKDPDLVAAVRSEQVKLEGIPGVEVPDLVRTADPVEGGEIPRPQQVVDAGSRAPLPPALPGSAGSSTFRFERWNSRKNPPSG